MCKIIISLLFTVLFGIVLIKNSNAEENLPVTTDSRIKTVVFNENEVIQLKFHYGFQSFIEFSDDEEIELISLGESFPWRVTPAGKRLFISGHEITPANIDVMCTEKQIESLLKNKTIKKKKEVSDEKSRKNSTTD